MKYLIPLVCILALSACGNQETNHDKVSSQNQIENSLTPSMNPSVVSVPLSASSSASIHLPIIGTGTNP